MNQRSDATLSEGTVSANKEFLLAMAAEINRCSRENVSNTPDFILAEFLGATLIAFENASRAREKWYGKSLSIGGSTITASGATPRTDAFYFPNGVDASSMRVPHIQESINFARQLEEASLPEARFVPNLDGRDFYELMQGYRHLPTEDAAAQFGAVRQYLRDGTLPWPTYEIIEPALAKDAGSKKEPK